MIDIRWFCSSWIGRLFFFADKISSDTDPSSISVRERGNSGFTLVEALVSTAVLGVLVTVLMTVINQINDSSLSQRSRMDMLLESHIAAVNLETSLRRLFQPRLLNNPTNSGWQFQGANGGGDFLTNFGDQSSFSGCDPANQDRLSSYVSHYQAVGSGVSDRRSLFLTLSEGGTVVEDCAIVKRNRSHSASDLSSDRAFPVLDQDFTDVSGLQTLANNVDQFLLRYYDAETDVWVNEWDSTDSSSPVQHNKMPDAIEYAFRSFDPDGHIAPIWFRGTINLKEQQE